MKILGLRLIGFERGFMKSPGQKESLSENNRALIGFIFGLVVIGFAVHIFHVNDFDFSNMQRGVRLILSGVNPWAPETRIADYYNPPFAVIFQWLMLFTTPRIYLTVGGALLFAFAFYKKAWVALAWFGTNTFLWMISAGGIDMFLVGAGLLLLFAGDRYYSKWYGLALRVLAYGLLMTKPQGTIFIVALYFLLRWDWKGLLASILVYGLPFIRLYPDWIRVLISDPPVYQIETPHTLWGQFGPILAALIAVAVSFSRRWKFWQLGGALAGILTPYGMPGLPIFLTLSAVSKRAAIPIVMIYSACLAGLTWVQPPPGVDYYAYMNPRMTIYHLSMLGLALALACLSGSNSQAEDRETIALWEGIRRLWRRIKSGRPAAKPLVEPSSAHTD
jgi:hypothetical protein